MGQALQAQCSTPQTPGCLHPDPSPTYEYPSHQANSQSLPGFSLNLTSCKRPSRSLPPSKLNPLDTLSHCISCSFPSEDLSQFVHRHNLCAYLRSTCIQPETTNPLKKGNEIATAHCYNHTAQQSGWHITGTQTLGLN